MEDSTTESTRTSVNNKIDNFVEGDLEHATEMLSALWEIANKDGDVKAPSGTAPAVSYSGFAFFYLRCYWDVGCFRSRLPRRVPGTGDP